MLSLTDCIGFCGLSREELAAVAEHERVPEIIATGIACHLLDLDDGYRRIGAMIADDIDWAVRAGRSPHAQDLMCTLKTFVAAHPEAWESLRVRKCLDA